MSSNLGPSRSTAKDIVINSNAPKTTIWQNENVKKLFRILLTLFYGQFFANALYDNLIRGIPYIVENGSAFGIVRVSIGVIIIALVVVGMIAIWKKIWPLVFGSAIVLIVVSIASLVINIIDLVQRRERKEIDGREVGSEIAEIIVEFILRAAAIVLQFLYAKFLHVSYQPVATSA
jgi:hypothetical protein